MLKSYAYSMAWQNAQRAITAYFKIIHDFIYNPEENQETHHSR
jgi:hypothetical protein